MCNSFIPLGRIRTRSYSIEPKQQPPVPRPLSLSKAPRLTLKKKSKPVVKRFSPTNKWQKPSQAKVMLTAAGEQQVFAEINLEAAVETQAPAQRQRSYSTWSGLILTSLIADCAFGLKTMPLFSIFNPMILAIAIGMILQNVIGMPAMVTPGIKFTVRKLLRLAIILLGLQLTATQIIEVGSPGLRVIAITLAATFVFTLIMGRLLKVDRKLTNLIAAGTSICGASAVIATNTVTEAKDEDVAYAVACVTVFGSLSMFLYPLLPGLLHLTPKTFGLWAGASIHEIAQVIAAAFQDGKDAGDVGTIAKLARVAMLAPTILLLAAITKIGRRLSKSCENQALCAQAPVPWFIFGFIGLIGLSSVITLPAGLKQIIVFLTVYLLVMAMGAMGLETNIGKLRTEGARPLVLGGLSWIFISVLSLVLIKSML